MSSSTKLEADSPHRPDSPFYRRRGSHSTQVLGSAALMSPRTTPVSSISLNEPRTPPRTSTPNTSSQLNPRSSIFQPFKPAPSVLELSSLSLSERVQDASSAGGGGSGSARSRWTSDSQGVPALQTGIDTPASEASFPPLTPPNRDEDETYGAPGSTYSPLASILPNPRLKQMGKNPSKGEGTEIGSVGRYLMITGIPKTVSELQIKSVIEGIAESQAVICKNLHSKGWVLITFYDTREAEKVQEALRSHSVRFDDDTPLVSLSCLRVERDAVLQMLGKKQGWDGVWLHCDSTLTIEFEGPHGVTLSGMKKCFSMYGELKVFEQEDHHGKKFTADFWDTRQARNAINSLDGQKIQGGELKVKLKSNLQTRLKSKPGSTDRSSGSFTLGSAAFRSGSVFTSLPLEPAFNPDIHDPFSSRHDLSSSFSLDASHSSDQRRGPHSFHTSPTAVSFSSPSRSSQQSPTWSPWSSDRPPRFAALERRASEHSLTDGMSSSTHGSGRLGLHKSWGSGWNLNDRQAIPPENKVYPERILSGLDWRTTVMIKDVPNKLSRKELVEILSEVVPGEFDFVYLRFDFNNHCNVGYAFVNFTSVKALYQFIQLRVGRKWNMFSSEKVLQELSYANIQGKAALINKFRNSAVMDVIEPWRPQIFYSSGALKGQPEPFPEADNLAQRQRSQSARLSMLPGFSSAVAEDSSAYEYDYATSVFDPSYGF